MNDALRQAAAVDPGWARKEARRRMLLIGVTVGALLAIGVGTVALVIGVHNETRITSVEQSACADAQEHPTDAKAVHECQVIRAAAERTADQNVNCIPFRRAGYICPRPGSPIAEEHRAREIREAVGPRGEVQPSGGDASIPSTGHSIPAPGDGGSTDQPSTPHAPSVPHQSPPPAEPGRSTEPPAPTATSPSQPPSSTTTEPPLVEAPPEVPGNGNGVGEVLGGVGKAVEGTGTVVEETGKGVSETVHGTVCSVGIGQC